MRNLILFDSDIRDRLLPLTYTRPVCELRVGILSIREKWEKHLGGKASYITQDYLNEKYPINISSDNYVINGSLLPTDDILRLVKDLKPSVALLHGESEDLIAARLTQDQFTRLIENNDPDDISGLKIDKFPPRLVDSLTKIFTYNGSEIESDFNLLTRGRTSAPLSATNTLIGDGPVFLEEGAWVEGATLNAQNGPIYIGKNATVMEGSMLRGPIAVCDNATIKMGAKIYGETTIGPWSKAGGEIGNSVLYAYSNKGHDGYLGNSVIGEWCNIGADTNVSNLKNNYTEVRLWDYPSQRFQPTGEQFCGLIMGDHSKCGINTMFNTGTVVGVSANIFGDGYPRNFIPSFAWGGASGFSTYDLEKAYDTAEKVMARRSQNLSHAERLILMRVFEDSAVHRRWEPKK
ncbi:MAG: glucose-1-phosphate thymidylyltransferase [Bacteroidetes bacterium]|nr:glucose-1-phosphate thymidylyltransferase [Bacteroidota bacterium]